MEKNVRPPGTGTKTASEVAYRAVSYDQLWTIF